MSLFIQNNYGTINHFENAAITIHNGQTTVEPHHQPASQAEEIQPVDTSFFCTKQFTVDIIEKNIRQAIELASSKADACRRLMSLEIQGYIVLSNVKDEQKAALVNPFAAPKFTLTGEDFRKARNS